MQDALPQPEQRDLGECLSDFGLSDFGGPASELALSADYIPRTPPMSTMYFSLVAFWWCFRHFLDMGAFLGNREYLHQEGGLRSQNAISK